MPDRIAVARKQIDPGPAISNWLRNAFTAIRQRNFRHAIRSLRFRNPNHRVAKVHLVLLIGVSSLYTRNPVSVMMRITLPGTLVHRTQSRCCSDHVT